MHFYFQQGISPLTHSSPKVSLNLGAIHTGIWRVEGGMRRRKMRTYNKKKFPYFRIFVYLHKQEL